MYFLTRKRNQYQRKSPAQHSCWHQPLIRCCPGSSWWVWQRLLACCRVSLKQLHHHPRGCFLNTRVVRCHLCHLQSCGARWAGGSSSCKSQVSTRVQQSHCRLTSLGLLSLAWSEVAGGWPRRGNCHGWLQNDKIEVNGEYVKRKREWWGTCSARHIYDINTNLWLIIIICPHVCVKELIPDETLMFVFQKWHE